MSEHIHQKGKAVGMDVNLSNFLTDSDGTVIDTPKYLKKSEKKLKKAQRKLSRMYESAKKDNRKLSEPENYQNQRQKVAEIHKHVANIWNKPVDYDGVRCNC